MSDEGEIAILKKMDKLEKSFMEMSNDARLIAQEYRLTLTEVQNLQNKLNVQEEIIVQLLTKVEFLEHMVK